MQKKKSFEAFFREGRFVSFSVNMVRNKREQADGTLVHLHKSSLGVQDFRLS